ncbi:aminopeptidase O [Erpetoichthys calabaricus]|uniref:Aminopeptidase O n=1 Tax=Erpetoichthys calabaricus TaxID=27687 RepID=A0A8C4S039_ERPCA|nr:aminopeptidase O [Erpetoichthys calabaricus]XP_051785627.1 aminopeptidase O [Erpetoichthys calabaricus]XP_051785628.1 aminopeptidase O [Erpetoichthys calabaricus]
MEINLDPNKHDLPLRANTSHMLVRHYVLDLAVNFKKRVISGNIVLFFETAKEADTICKPEREQDCPESCKLCRQETPDLTDFPVTSASTHSTQFDANDVSGWGSNRKDNSHKNCRHGNIMLTSGISKEGCRDTEDCGSEDFVLVLDCCDLLVVKVEEVSNCIEPHIKKLVSRISGQDAVTQQPMKKEKIHAIDELVSLPASLWQEQHKMYLECSRALGCGELRFETDSWSLQIRKPGIKTARDFPHIVRIWYETKPSGGSVRWTQDQSGRQCVYTAGSPINNRALFPCQEPPVAMSTWQATVQAPSECVVLLSGENTAAPSDTPQGLSNWFYYVTMPMPASTFTIAVGHWIEVNLKHTLICDTNDSTETAATQTHSSCPVKCGHLDYPCPFQESAAHLKAVIPYRVFAPVSLQEKLQEVLLPLLPKCLKAAHNVLGVHPFRRIDILLVPAGFSSLGMASPHIIFLSQSILPGKSYLCGARLCHEIAHAWFGLAIGARDWTEEWVSEGFATFLEDVIWACAQKLPQEEALKQQELKAFLRFRRLRDELQISEEQLQILRPKGEHTGEVSESGSSQVKHGLNPDKIFMQVHYLKGFFLLRFLASKIKEELYLQFFRYFVEKFHGQLILSQDFLKMLLRHFPEIERQGLSLKSINEVWLDSTGIPKPLLEECNIWLKNQLVQEVKQELPKWIHFNQRKRRGTKRKKTTEGEGEIFRELLPDQLVLLLEFLLEEEVLSVSTLQMLQKIYSIQEQDAEVRHRWCELVVKHKYTKAYKDVEQFLTQDQAMGVYLYGELMVNEDARQQMIARNCFRAVQEEMDPASRSVVEEMIF